MLWLAFLISLSGILIISRKNLSLGLVSGSLILGLMTLSPARLLDRIIFTITDPSIILLTLAMGIIPMIGGTLKESGQIDNLVENLRISRKYLLATSAALMGLLPMPGGALLSAPILEKAGQDIPGELNAVINNWFRHIFILIYPLAPALIVAAEICDLDVYRAILYILPGAVFAYILGHLFFLRHINGRLTYTGQFSLKALSVPLLIILSAPVLDFILKKALGMGSLATLIGVVTGFTLSIALSRKKLDLKDLTRRMKPWNFALIILGMFLYLHIFQASDTSTVIAELPLPPLMLAIIAGFLLGLLTGRVQLPASIVLPIYLGAQSQITPFIFALIYIAIYFGYIISPVHPCLVVTCEYFHVSIREMIKRMVLPTAIIIAAVIILALLFG
nr:DUF401 family protein [candidate division Zixibacteria bacterium]